MDEPVLSHEASEGQGTLVVRRTSPSDIKMRDLYVELDGGPVANLQFKDRYEAALSAGAHTLVVTNRLYSRTVVLDVVPGGLQTFEAANEATGCFAILFVVFGIAPYKVSVTPVLVGSTVSQE